eukprot:scaffold235848_cov33-Tisochrysis_lutea.AAC.3
MEGWSTICIWERSPSPVAGAAERVSNKPMGMNCDAEYCSRGGAGRTAPLVEFGFASSSETDARGAAAAASALGWRWKLPRL